jgi:predicted nucleic acid-binding Zn ribbon protein
MKQNTAVLGGGDMNQEDSVSRLSDDSQRMIITKRTEFTVEMDQASRESQGSPLDISKDDRSEAVPGPVPH